MRRIVGLLILGCMGSFLPGQYIETTILLPDSTSGLTSVGSLVFHSPTSTMYVGGNQSFLVAVNAQTNAKLTKVDVGSGPHLLCSAPPENKVYCVNQDATVTVIDGVTNRLAKTFSVEQTVTDLIYNGKEGKLYCGNKTDSLFRVIDCVGDSVVARVPVSFGPGALCYNPQSNRIYCAHSTRDEVSVIDCAADTVVDIVWVRGVEPQDICYDSASNCVYTVNSASNTVSAIDCGGDTFAGLVFVGDDPVTIIAGPPGKVYCANYNDASISVISGSGVKTIKAGRRPKALGFDPVNGKVYCAANYRDSVAVIDAAYDTVVAKIRIGSDAAALCHNPAGNNTYVACGGSAVPAIGGVSDTVEAVVTFAACTPGPLCYNTTSNRLYCLDRTRDLLFVVDGDSNCLLETLRTGRSPGALIWSSASNKVYIANSSDSTVSILDCAGDSLVANLVTGYSPRALCCSEDGKVYVANQSGGVAVIDGSGDSVRTVIPVGSGPSPLCYDRTDNKVYVGRYYGSGDTVTVIDADGDSVVATIPVPPLGHASVCWNQNHNKVYVSDPECESLAVIDCAGDSVLRNIRVTTGLDRMYSDSVCDKVYGVDNGRGYLRIIRPATDSYYKNLSVGYVNSILDNGKQGPANRIYCVDREAARVTVVGAYKMDSVLCRIAVGDYPVALAWNPTHSRVYVSNSGSSSISVIRDTFGVGMVESQSHSSSHKQQVTIVRGVLDLGADGRQNAGYRAELLDAAGRRVMTLHAGANDVRVLAPGVYFVRTDQTQARAQAILKVVITQ